MVQTPQQKRANAKFDKFNEKKMGKPESVYKKKETPKLPISKFWLVLLVFVIIAPVIFEPLKLLPQVWDWIRSVLVQFGLMSK